MFVPVHPASVNTAYPYRAPFRPVVWQLGWGARLNPVTGYMMFNTGLIEALAGQKQAVIPGLYQLLSTSISTLQIVEGLYLAQRLVELKTPGVKTLYGATTRFNQITDQTMSGRLIQIYLAGFYRKLGAPETFGPMLEMLIRNSVQPRSQIYPSALNPAEEIGGAVLQQIADETVHAVMQRLNVKVRGE